MKSHFLLLFLIVFFIYSCHKPDTKLLYYHDAEPDTTWINLHNSIEFNHAHSGKQVSFIDSISPYSIGLKKTISTISDAPVKKVIISAWIWIDSLSQLKDLSVVASVDEGNKNIFWAGQPVGDQVHEPSKWTFVKKEITFPENIQPYQRFTGYFLNNSKIKILIDDINFEFKTKDNL